MAEQDRFPDEPEDEGQERPEEFEEGDDLEGLEGSGPGDLDPGERQDIEADLGDLEGMRGVFEAQGVKGVVIACPDCGSNHFYDWDLLRESLEHMLTTGEPRMHEPAFEPREEEYIQWDYGKGYVDALSDAGLDRARPVDVSSCPWCQGTLEPHFAYCPRCGRSLAAVRIYHELIERGMEDREVRALLVRAGFEPFQSA